MSLPINTKTKIIEIIDGFIEVRSISESLADEIELLFTQPLEVKDENIVDWHKKKFPDADKWDVYKKLLEEVGELAEAIARESYNNIELEFGDVNICLIVLAKKLSVDRTESVTKAHQKNLNKTLKGNNDRLSQQNILRPAKRKRQDRRDAV